MDTYGLNFYFCDLKSHDDSCPKADHCKRWLAIKDVEYNEYQNLGVARLHNVCKRTNYALYMKEDGYVEENDNAESNV